MTTQPTDQPVRGGASASMQRRGVFAALSALVAGLVIRQTIQPVQASTPALLANTETAGVTNSVVGPSIISASSSFTSPNGILIADAHLAPSTGAQAAVHGAANAFAAPPEICGVYGQATPFTGVLGQSDTGFGVKGLSRSGSGLRGEIPASSAANAIAIYGLNNSSYAGAGPGAGGFGVYGLCAKGHGLVGATAAVGGAAVVGATNGVVGAYAGAFYGPVIVGGAFTVVGGPKSAAVPHPDGSHRRLYCMESPESWFEDFGDGHLAEGRADVTIDPDFAAIAETSKYHVFLTAYNNDNVLYVTERTASGFSVRSRESDACGPFSWRIVAKRKDIAGVRLEQVSVPLEPQLPGPAMDAMDSDRIGNIPCVAINDKKSDPRSPRSNYRKLTRSCPRHAERRLAVPQSGRFSHPCTQSTLERWTTSESAQHLHFS